MESATSGGLSFLAGGSSPHVSDPDVVFAWHSAELVWLTRKTYCRPRITPRPTAVIIRHSHGTINASAGAFARE